MRRVAVLRAMAVLWAASVVVGCVKTSSTPSSSPSNRPTCAEQVYALELHCVDGRTLVGDKHLVTDISSRDALGNIQVVVEIPAGTNAKWEVEKRSGYLQWELDGGKPRVVNYAAYPANYGMIPRTLLPRALGGDGDPLDVVVLGSVVPRGSIVSARPVGMLKLLDRGEQDDKVIAVLENSVFADVNTLAELNDKFPGVVTLLEVWFSHYKGEGKMVLQAIVDEKEALKVIVAAEQAYMTGQ